MNHELVWNSDPNFIPMTDENLISYSIGYSGATYLITTYKRILESPFQNPDIIDYCKIFISIKTGDPFSPLSRNRLELVPLTIAKDRCQKYENTLVSMNFWRNSTALPRGS